MPAPRTDDSFRPGSPGATPARRAARGLFVRLVSWVALAAVSAAGLRWRDGVWPSPSRWRAERGAARAAGVDLESPGAGETGHRATLLHPYLGFTQEPFDVSEGGFHVDDLGFVQAGAVARPIQPEAMTIGVFGGSVAQQFALSQGAALERELSAAPFARGRPVRVVNLAMGGYKQPQQLATLVWTQAMEVRLDAVVLLDGFNDLVLPEAENRGSGVHASYPRGWRALIETAVSGERLLTAGELRSVERLRARRAGLCAARPLVWSPACHLLWSWSDRRLQLREAALRRDLERASSQPPAGALGPPSPSHGTKRRLREHAEFWGRNAVLMRQLCAARGIAFLHFLQPNQYVAGSKPMSAAERRLALRADSSYGAIAASGYGELQRVGRELHEAGEPFEDLTGLFAAVDDPVYADDCCHFNDRGNALLRQRIGAGLERALAAASPLAEGAARRGAAQSARKPTQAIPAAASAVPTAGSQSAAVSSSQR
jgi:hypothetical protein